VVDIVTKVVVIPWLLRRALRDEVYTRREITRALNIATSLLMALGLTVVAYLLSTPLLAIGDGAAVGLNLPIGLAGLLIGGLTAAVRREAVPLFLGLLAMDKFRFLCGHRGRIGNAVDCRSIHRVRRGHSGVHCQRTDPRGTRTHRHH
jgi:hydrogenase-4 membrane subunit HyfE